MSVETVVTLDEQWAAVEALLPSGAIFGLSKERGMYRALAALDSVVLYGPPVADYQGLGDTPVAALQDLAFRIKAAS